MGNDRYLYYLPGRELNHDHVHWLASIMNTEHRILSPLLLRLPLIKIRFCSQKDSKISFPLDE